MDINSKAEQFAKAKMEGYDGGHDWLHIERVRNLARTINNEEGIADDFLLDLAAIIHDVNDSKFRISGDGYSALESFLEDNGLSEVKTRIIDIIKNISFSNKNKTGDVADPLLMVLQDADRLDALGAIGIARAFSYGGFRNNPIYIPNGEAGGREGTTIHHFYEKLLKLKDMMNTSTGKRIAEERHTRMKVFLEQFYSEWGEIF
ncbi:MAG TPA: HD domain-containing protein [Bacteroidales bacterium]|nr:HD domain-containing protein [Bacteroidales bacterium]